jgi:SAM-dependent methyltransferase
MIEQHELNRQRWNELTPVHARSEFYNIDGFLKGAPALDDVEIGGLGDLSGKSLLHLQCHLGLGTLEAARRGARVVGVDFSAASIATAREMAAKADLTERARFICCDVLELDQESHETFDVVFTSYGVLTWLFNLPKWGQIVARFLRPGGHLFIAEIHPTAFMFAEQGEPLTVAYDYFNSPEGILLPPSPDYADANYTAAQAERYWAWSLEDIFRSLTDAGLAITDFREFPFSCYRQFPHMTRGDDGHWYLPPHVPRAPLLFALRAVHKIKN